MILVQPRREPPTAGPGRSGWLPAAALAAALLFAPAGAGAQDAASPVPDAATPVVAADAAPSPTPDVMATAVAVAAVMGEVQAGSVSRVGSIPIEGRSSASDLATAEAASAQTAVALQVEATVNAQVAAAAEATAVAAAELATRTAIEAAEAQNRSTATAVAAEVATRSAIDAERTAVAASLQATYEAAAAATANAQATSVAHVTETAIAGDVATRQAMATATTAARRATATAVVLAQTPVVLGGQILSVSGQTLTLGIPGGTPAAWQLGPRTSVTLNRTPVPAEKLKAGDSAEVVVASSGEVQAVRVTRVGGNGLPVDPLLLGLGAAGAAVVAGLLLRRKQEPFIVKPKPAPGEK